MSSTCVDIKAARDRDRVFFVIKSMATRIGMGTVKQTQVITAVSELVSNILKYAGEGQVCISVTGEGGVKKIVVLASDNGPGIADINLAMTKGYSTGKTLGVGLPGAKALSDEFEVDTASGSGTVVRIAKWV